jgi:predicted TIM-barrel fold metal-dependent hydrolase
MTMSNDTTASPRNLRGHPVTGIDGHAHVFVRGLSLASGRRYAPAYEATLDDYRAMLASLGLSHGVLVQPSFLGTDNRFLLSCLDAYPAQLRGIVVVDPAHDLVQIDTWHARGVVGVRANLIGTALPDFGSPAWAAFLERMVALDWHLEVQIEAHRLPDIAPALLHSGVRIVVDHFGRLDPALGLDDPGFASLLSLGATRQVWVKVSGAYRVSPDPHDPAAALAIATRAWPALLREFGVGRLVWGTDWPHTQFEDVQNARLTLDHLHAFVTEPEQLQAVLVDTPAALFQFA